MKKKVIATSIVAGLLAVSSSAMAEEEMGYDTGIYQLGTSVSMFDKTPTLDTTHTKACCGGGQSFYSGDSTLVSFKSIKHPDHSDMGFGYGTIGYDQDKMIFNGKMLGVGNTFSAV